MLPWKERHATLSQPGRSACKYCSIRWAHTRRWRRVSRRQEAENRGIEQTGEGDTDVDTRPRWEQQQQTAAESQYSVRFLLMYEVISGSLTQLSHVRTEIKPHKLHIISFKFSHCSFSDYVFFCFAHIFLKKCLKISLNCRLALQMIDNKASISNHSTQ